MTKSALILCLLLTAVASNGSIYAAEAPYDAATKTALQTVIRHQLEAFRNNDGRAAESFAAPDIQAQFASPHEFMSMVQRSYAALIDPRSTIFTDTVPSPYGPLQKMTVVAKDGSVWTAIYSFEQVDGQWRITGCGLGHEADQEDI